MHAYNYPGERKSAADPSRFRDCKDIVVDRQTHTQTYKLATWVNHKQACHSMSVV